MTEVLRPGQWLVGAERDLASAGLLLEARGDLSSVVAFHARQCAERALKAVLMQFGAEIPYTHDIEKLIAAVQEAGLEVSQELFSSVRLGTFAVQEGYGDPYAVNRAEAEAAVEVAGRVLDWARSVVGGGGGAVGGV